MNVFKNLFKERGVKDVITLFHNPSSQASIRVHTLLKQVSANAHETATIDQAGEHSTQSKQDRQDFTLDVQEAPPTSDQLNSILEYLGPSTVSSVVQDATGTTDALRKFKKDDNTFQRPIVVDWSHGRAVAGDNESEILNLIRSIPKETK